MIFLDSMLPLFVSFGHPEDLEGMDSQDVRTPEPVQGFMCTFIVISHVNEVSAARQQIDDSLNSRSLRSQNQRHHRLCRVAQLCATNQAVFVRSVTCVRS